MRIHDNSPSVCQLGYTLIELMITIAIIGVLAAIAMVSYQTQIRQTQILTLYQEMNDFRLPYQILLGEGAGVTDFSPRGLDMPSQTKYCQFSVTEPAVSGITNDAIKCTIQNLPYVQGMTISLDRGANGTWQCRASSDIPHRYLPRACQ